MSLSNIPVELKLDPVMSQSESVYTITKGPSEILYTTDVCTNISLSGLRWSFTPISPHSYLDRRISLHMKQRYALTLDVPGSGPVFPVGSFPDELGIIGLKYIPLQGICSNVNITLNGSTLTLQAKEVIIPFSHYRTGIDLEEYTWGSMPCQKNVGATFDETYGSPRSQFANKNVNVIQDSNAISSHIVVESDGVNGAVITVEWDEYVIVPPFLAGLMEHHGLVGLNSDIKLEFIFSSEGIASMLGYDDVNGKLLSSVTSLGFVGNPYVTLKWIESPVPIPDPLAQTFLYPYIQANPFFTNVAAVPALAVGRSITTANAQLSGIPSDIFIFLRPTLSERTSFTADYFASITAIEITFNGKAGILSGATTTQLYDICVKNGIKIRRSDFDFGCGSVLKLKFDSDIPISQMGLAVGSAGTYNFYAKITYNNNVNDVVNYVATIIPVYDGIFKIHGGVASTNVNMVTTGDIINAAENMSESDSMANASADMIDGGSIFSSASRYIKRAGRDASAFYGRNKNAIDNVLEIGKRLGANVAVPALMTLAGLGYDYQSATDLMEANGLSAGGYDGGRLIDEPQKLLNGGSLIPVNINPMYFNRSFAQRKAVITGGSLYKNNSDYASHLKTVLKQRVNLNKSINNKRRY